ncbi:MAG: GNAT family N-acetyltransferase [Catenulispora sp.]|nr:GNAT family N-acetyltransferase [Catenulispora sp.]
MDTLHPASGPVDRTIVVNRVAEHQWHALDDDRVAGRGNAVRRPDGRLFVSVDAWHEAVFRRLASALLADLPRPLYTVVDETDIDQTAGWLLAGFSIGRRERGYLVPTDPADTGLVSADLASTRLADIGPAGTATAVPVPVPPPAGVTIIPAGSADGHRLRLLDRAIRDEIGATVGWQTMPAEVIALPPGVTVPDPSKYAVAAQGSEYVGMLRLATATRQPRIGLLAVRADHRRRGIARALLAHTLTTLHARGTRAAWAEITEANTAALALFEAAGARHAATNLELVRR